MKSALFVLGFVVVGCASEILPGSVPTDAGTDGPYSCSEMTDAGGTPYLDCTEETKSICGAAGLSCFAQSPGSCVCTWPIPDTCGEAIFQGDPAYQCCLVMSQFKYCTGQTLAYACYPPGPQVGPDGGLKYGCSFPTKPGAPKDLICCP